MTENLDGARLLIYSHDTFGLGHLRRCQLIAHALVERYKGLSILMLSGSPIVGTFDFRARVDFVRVPGVIKLYNGEYTSLGLHIDISETMAIRSQIIQHTAASYRPDLFLVDKEPLGLRGEIAPTLDQLKSRGTRIVLGVRDVLDGPARLRKEWQGAGKFDALSAFYDEIWVYGCSSFWDPFTDVDISPEIRARMAYAGFLRRSLPQQLKRIPSLEIDEPYVLITAGGGGDGYRFFDGVLSAYERDRDLPLAPVFVLGPFMKVEEQNELTNRIHEVPRAQVITYDNHLEFLIEDATAIIAMCGYNTFCEVLAFDKPALFIPRQAPREEQLIRARRAENLGLCSMLPIDEAGHTSIMIERIRDLSHQPPPSLKMPAEMLGGLERVCDLAHPHLTKKSAQKSTGGWISPHL